MASRGDSDRNGVDLEYLYNTNNVRVVSTFSTGRNPSARRGPSSCSIITRAGENNIAGSSSIFTQRRWISSSLCKRSNANGPNIQRIRTVHQPIEPKHIGIVIISRLVLQYDAEV